MLTEKKVSAMVGLLGLERNKYSFSVRDFVPVQKDMTPALLYESHRDADKSAGFFGASILLAIKDSENPKSVPELKAVANLENDLVISVAPLSPNN